MAFKLQSRFWTWATLPIAGASLYLAGSLLFSIQQSTRDIQEANKFIAQVEPALKDARRMRDGEVAQNPVAWKAFRLIFETDLDRLANRELGDPRILDLVAESRRQISAMDELVRTSQISSADSASRVIEGNVQLARNWNGLNREYNGRLALALTGPLEKWRDAAAMSILACMASLLLIALNRSFRRELKERARAEQRLKDSEARYRSLFQHVQEGIFQSSAEGRILAANPALRNILGLGEDEDLSSCDIGEMFYASPAERKRLVSRVESEGVLRNQELNLKTRDGKRLVVVANARAVRNQLGRLLYLEGTLFDITDRKAAAEESQRQIERLEEAQKLLESQARQLVEQSLEIAEARDGAVRSSSLKNDFLGNLSREIRPPLENLVNVSSLLLETHLDQRQKDLTEIARASAQFLLDTIGGILEYWQFEFGELPLAREPFSLHQTVEDVCDRWAVEAEGKGLEIVPLVRLGVPEKIMGDASRLNQVLSILLENAINCTDSGHASLTVSGTRDGAGNEHVRFDVKDLGGGVPTEDIPAIFEPFRQAKAIPDARGGAGIRLALANRMVEKMGGRMNFETQPGRGSQFSFLLPVEANSSSSPNTGSLAGRRILIVDDVAACREALAETAASWGLEVTMSPDAANALEMAREAADLGSRFEFILVDYELPGLSGLDLAEAMLDDPATASSNIILMVPPSLKGWIDEPVLSGLRAVVAKPIRAIGLLNILVANPLENEASRQSMAASLARLQLETARGASTGPERDCGHRHKPCVLVVEDNEVNRRVAVRLLEKMDICPEVAVNGIEAVRAVERKEYDLILMDCQMPEMDGLAATKAIRMLDGRRAKTPIVAMTANAMQGDREKCLKAGMNDYISKPVLFEDLRAMVFDWIERSTTAAR